MRRILLVVLWLGALGTALGVLDHIGQGALSAPPLADRDALRRWLDARDAATAAVALARMVGVALAWYLLVVTVLGLVARISRVPALVQLTDAVSVPAVRRLIGTLGGVGLAASAGTLLASDLLPGSDPPAPATATSDASVVLGRLPPGDDLVLRRLDDAAADPEAGPPSSGGPAGDGAHAWVVAPGDHLWHIAEATLADAWSRPPTDAEIVPYWTRVIEVNRDRLVDPEDPDLIHPGQTFLLPAIPLSGARQP